MDDSPARKYEIGDAVIWTDYSNGMRHPGVVRGYVERGPDDTDDPQVNGPLYDVELEPGQHGQMIVAEVDLSPSDGTETAPPADPLSSYDVERITQETGGTIVATLQRAHQDRLTIGALEHPHMRSLNTVTIRMYLDGEKTDAIDLGEDDIAGMITALRQAAEICWPPR